MGEPALCTVTSTATLNCQTICNLGSRLSISVQKTVSYEINLIADSQEIPTQIIHHRLGHDLTTARHLKYLTNWDIYYEITNWLKPWQREEP